MLGNALPTHSCSRALDLRSLERRLAELREMEDSGRISESEHRAARAAAIASI